MVKTQMVACLVSMATAFQVISCSKDTIPEPTPKMAIDNYATLYDYAGVQKRKHIAMHFHNFAEGEYERISAYIGRSDTLCNINGAYTVLTFVALPDTCVNNTAKH